MTTFVGALVAVAAVAVIVWRGLALYSYGLRKKNL